MPYAHRVEPGDALELAKVKTSAGDVEETDARAETQTLRIKLDELQELLYAAGMHSVLVVLQGRDTSGKDGAIRHLSTCLNVGSARVSSFKQPTAEELKHDFLWRVHPCAPERGAISIFNRSHYEDVLAVRVHKLVEKEVWKRRYDRINDFEHLLAQQNDTLILKFFLHISKDEQEERLRARETDPSKAWKLSAGDWKERAFWDEYTEAYEDALSRCSTKHAPWFVVPADHKWFRDLCIVEALVDALRPHRKAWKAKLDAQSKRERALLDSVRKP